ncbi:MAG: hypothetical protein K2N49_02000 [Ruminococcus sp.]|nr:hypothetical protein [Ruminococcus sp.]MDE7225622.1 hypothetical protein [Ruminococcus sp.]
MSMRTLEELRDKFCKELDGIARKDDLSAGDLETVHKLTDTIKNIDKICIMDMEEGYSGAGEWEARGHFGDEYSRRNEYGNSYAVSRKRDSTGRYSRNSRRMNDGRYSRDDGKEHMISKLEDMLDNAENDRVKSAIRKKINELERD